MAQPCWGILGLLLCAVSSLNAAEPEQIGRQVLEALRLAGQSLDAHGYQRVDRFHLLTISGTRGLSYEERQLATLRAQGQLLDKVVRAQQQDLPERLDDIALELQQSFRQRIEARAAVIPARDSITVVVIDESLRVESNVPAMLYHLQRGPWTRSPFAAEALLRSAEDSWTWLQLVAALLQSPSSSGSLDDRCQQLQAVRALAQAHGQGLSQYSNLVTAQAQRLREEQIMLAYLGEGEGGLPAAWKTLFYTAGLHLSLAPRQSDDQDVDLPEDDPFQLPEAQDVSAWLRLALESLREQQYQQALLALRYTATLQRSQQQTETLVESLRYLGGQVAELSFLTSVDASAFP